MSVLTKVKEIIRWARVTRAAAGSNAFHVQQVEYSGKIGDCLMIFPYGLHANLTPDSLVAMFSVGSDASNRAGIGWTADTRPDLKEGEVAVYHPRSGTLIKLNESGGINVVSVSEVTVDAPKVTLTAEDIVSNSTNYTINTANFQLNCESGAIVASSSFDFTGVVTANGKDIDDTHTHKAGTPPGDTGAVN